jgi:hypothetical protein
MSQNNSVKIAPPLVSKGQKLRGAFLDLSTKVVQKRTAKQGASNAVTCPVGFLDKRLKVVQAL